VSVPEVPGTTMSRSVCERCVQYILVFTLYGIHEMQTIVRTDVRGDCHVAHFTGQGSFSAAFAKSLRPLVRLCGYAFISTTGLSLELSVIP